MRAGQQASPQATNRQQAGSYKDKSSSFPLWELACKRIVAVNGHHLRRRIASRLAPTKTRARLFPYGSLPASDAWRSTGITSGDESPAGWLLQGQELVFSPVGACLQANCGGQRASPQATNRQQAGSYKDRSSSFPLWELAYKRIVAVDGHHLRRRIASKLAPTKTRARLFPCGSLPASDACRATCITSGDESPAGWLLQTKSKKPAAKGRFFLCLTNQRF